MNLVKIDDELITAEDLIKFLKFAGRYDSLIEDLVKDKLTVHAARKTGLEASVEEIQERADQVRRIRGLHRAVDMNRWLNAMGINLDDFEQFVVEMVLLEKMTEVICSDAAVEEYFSMNSPKFDSVQLSHIVLDSEGKAKEIMAILEDEPENFAELAREYSLADTSKEGGHIGKVLRGSLQGEVEAKVFNAPAGTLLGPFKSPDEAHFEVFVVNAKVPASLNAETKAEVRRILKEQWLGARAREHVIEACANDG
jgi:parvulin-like peptidyl-prolyl isomerase